MDTADESLRHVHLSRLPSGYIYDPHSNDADCTNGLSTMTFQPQEALPSVEDFDENSGDLNRKYTEQFEGPEKTLEVCYRRTDGKAYVPPEPGDKVALRTLSRRDLELVCKKAHCTILSSISNQYLDAYVLSESSLFVYDYMIVLKTCGTTTLLRCLALLIELGRGIGLELDWVGYSRKNFNFPAQQCYPHGSFTQELDYLYSHRKLCDVLDGNGYTLGPINDDHWFVFIADQTLRSRVEGIDNDRVLNIMMFDIDPDVASLFYYDRYDGRVSSQESDEETTRRISSEQTRVSGIDSLYPGALFDARAFEPCGYSMNAILFQSYCTIHITPEEGSSYASFETNQKLSQYNSLISNVVRTFRPKRFILTLMADVDGFKEIKEIPLTATATASWIVVPAVGKSSTSVSVKKEMLYKRTTVASIKVEDDCICLMGNWALEKDSPDSHARDIRYQMMANGSRESVL